eukprot:1993509-Amphidinium_carterae.1
MPCFIKFSRLEVPKCLGFPRLEVIAMQLMYDCSTAERNTPGGSVQDDMLTANQLWDGLELYAGGLYKTSLLIAQFRNPRIATPAAR